MPITANLDEFPNDSQRARLYLMPSPYQEIVHMCNDNIEDRFTIAEALPKIELGTGSD